MKLGLIENNLNVAPDACNAYVMDGQNKTGIDEGGRLEISFTNK